MSYYENKYTQALKIYIMLPISSGKCHVLAAYFNPHKFSMILNDEQQLIQMKNLT